MNLSKSLNLEKLIYRKGLNYKGSLLAFKTNHNSRNEFNSEVANSRRSETGTENFNSKRRIKSKTWDTSWFIYQSVGTKTKMQKKGAWWVKTNARRLILRWNLSFVNANLVPSGFNQCNGVQATAIDALAQDAKSCVFCKKAEKIFDYSIAFGINSDDFTIPRTGTTLPVTPTNPSSGRAIRLLRHRNNAINSFTNHSGTYEGQTVTTNTLFWNRCDN